LNIDLTAQIGLHGKLKLPDCVTTIAALRTAQMTFARIEQLDFIKFDGTYQLREGCGPSGTILEKNCSYFLQFNSQQGYCQSIFRNPQFDLGSVPFPEVGCRPFGMGAREKESYAKYVDAFEHIYKQCGKAQ
jgi:hypothetical protein